MFTPQTRLVHAVWLALLFALIGNAAIADEQTQAELESVRSKIKDVKQEIKQAQIQTRQLRDELMENEIASATTLAHLRNIKNQMRQQRLSIDSLDEQKSQYARQLTAEQQKLSEQIRTAYKIGPNNYIKLILNQEDSALVGRMLAYHNYHNRSRIAQIDTINKKLQSLADIEQSIEQETSVLEQLKQLHEENMQQYSAFRDSRNEIISRLQNDITQQGAELRMLQENEQELAALLNQLSKQEATATGIFENTTPFGDLKGKLEWPVKGKLVKQFGLPKKGDGVLKWQGVLIGAKSGANIQTVSAGKIVFADWFRNLGLLLIIDHGNEYMSLYGHNQNLLKKVGDWVEPGEIIATLGDSGGQTEFGLYFEIRKNGSPVNPVQWCRR